MTLRKLIELTYGGDRNKAAKNSGVSLEQINNNIDRELTELKGGGWIIIRKNAAVYK